jgi:hypothetical protein
LARVQAGAEAKNQGALTDLAALETWKVRTDLWASFARVRVCSTKKRSQRGGPKTSDRRMLATAMPFLKTRQFVASARQSEDLKFCQKKIPEICIQSLELNKTFTIYPMKTNGECAMRRDFKGLA